MTAPGWRIDRWKDRIVPALLVALAAGLVHVVARAARDAQQAHAEASEKIRVTAAEIAAFNLGERLRASLSASVDRALIPPSGGPVDSAWLSATLKRADSMYTCRCTSLPRPEAAFAMSARGRLVIASDSAGPATRSALDAFFRALVARRAVSASPALVFGLAEEGPWAVAALVDSDTTQPRAVGLVLSTRSLELDVLPRLLAYRTPLLPLSATAHTPADSVASFRLLSRSGDPLARTASSFAVAHGRAVTVIGDSAFLVEAQLSPAVTEALGATVRTQSIFDVRLLTTLVMLLLGALAVMAFRAVALARFRHQFAVAAAHELRTPLTQVMMYGEMLSLGRLQGPDDQRKAAGVVVREARRMMEAVEGILHHTRAERRKIQLALASHRLVPVVQEVMTELQPLANSRLVDLTVDVARDPQVLVDRAALTRVLSNLVENGIKYGGKRVHLSAHSSASEVEVLVDDAGPGIPASRRATVWKPFARLENADMASGAGMGLTIVAELVAAMHGVVSVGDSPMGGARFRVVFPSAHGDRG